jgi:putative Mg2+ transporter-C (MgtC) family protein
MGELEGLLRLVLALVAGALLGLEREAADKPAGMRTLGLVSLGACLFTLVGILAFGSGDPGSRVAAQIVTGVGFLGAGAILHLRGAIVGLTTAAGIWATAAIGMAYGGGLYVLATGGTVIALVVLRLLPTLPGPLHPHRAQRPATERSGEDEEGPTGA